MGTDGFTFDRPAKRLVAFVDISAPNVVFSVGSVLAAAAFSVCASSAGASNQTVNPGQLHHGSVSVQFAAREEDADFCVSSALSEIRERSALTWAQISNALGVSRRAIHAWMAGTSGVARDNAARIEQMLALVRLPGDQPTFKVRHRILEAFGALPVADKDDGELPILLSDSRPIKHPAVKKSYSKMRIRRG